ncbi:MAG: glutamine-hydrolyzing GMP synthase, partial [Deltaproteobacteria bacterium]|nr:glutamine-hydrolyzing GMP synthase [Deltaproteobacteria bacterium]
MLEAVRDEIAVLDFGGQYAHLIARRVRRLGVLARLHRPEDFDPAAPRIAGIILSGGPDSVDAPGAPRAGFDLRAVRVPMLGLCYGHQLLARDFGGRVEAGREGEYGQVRARLDPTCPLFSGLPEDQAVWMSHRDRVTSLPDGFRTVASSSAVPVAGFEHPDRRIFGLQFHPEVTHTPGGEAMLDRFLGLCVAHRAWSPGDQAAQILERIRVTVGDRRVLLLVSGGVDSLVTLKLCVDALGPERVRGIHVDTGFMRLGESEEIAGELRNLGYGSLEVVDASEAFFRALAGRVDPEEKRRAVGRLFVEVVHEALSGLAPDRGWMLAQGTIYPDTIESGGTAKADTIKTHHNRVPEIDELLARGLVVEPLRDLYKDEVRALGRALGLPDRLLARHPFPGPGLVIRILCSDTATPPAGFDHEAGAVEAMAREASLRSMVLPVRSVGVQGDSRTYAHPALVWQEEGRAPPSWTHLKAFAARLINTRRSVNRVVFSARPINPSELHLGLSHADAAAAERL